jgi:hypothetical protein
MLFLLFLACKEAEQIPINEICEEEVSVTEIAYGLTDEQKEVSHVIEEEFNEMEIPSNITAAAIVNAIAESRLNPNAIGDNGKAVGAFQLHKNGLGKNLSVKERKNIHTSANIVGVQILKNDKLYELDNNNAQISLLSEVIAEEIMKPSNIDKQKYRRSRLANQIFPERIW